MGFFKRAVALSKGVAFEVAVMLDEVFGLLARDGQVQSIGLRERVHHARLRVPLLTFKDDHGRGGVFVETGDGADSLPGVNNVLSDTEHASSNY